MNLRSTVHWQTRSNYLNGLCASFAEGYKQLYPEVEKKLLGQHLCEMHVVCIDNGHIIDVTGVWKDFDQYANNLITDYSTIYKMYLPVHIPHHGPKPPYDPNYIRVENLKLGEYDVDDLIPPYDRPTEIAKAVIRRGQCWKRFNSIVRANNVCIG